MNLEKVQKDKHVCLASVIEESTLWHKRLVHASISKIAKLSKNELVKGLSKIKYIKESIYDACQVGKQIRTTF